MVTVPGSFQQSGSVRADAPTETIHFERGRPGLPGKEDKKGCPNRKARLAGFAMTKRWSKPPLTEKTCGPLQALKQEKAQGRSLSIKQHVVFVHGTSVHDDFETGV